MEQKRLPIRILIVEDNPTDALLLQQDFKDVAGAEFITVWVERLKDALRTLTTASFDVVLLDLGLPDANGPETVTRLRQDQPEVPVVVLTGLDDDSVGTKAMQLGAQDYLVKGHCPPALLGRSIRYAIERKRAETAMMAQLKESAIAEERNRLAGEMHDTLAQGLAGILFQLEAARELYSQSPPVAIKHMERAEALARASLAEARRAVWALRPPELDAEGLVGAVRCFLDRFAAGGPTTVELTVTGEPYPLPNKKALALLRICQEAVTNAFWHAQASKIQVRISYQPSSVDLCVQDNGRGLNSQLSATGKGLGLIGMRERAEQIGAEIEISSEPGQGTRLTVETRSSVGDLECPTP